MDYTRSNLVVYLPQSGDRLRRAGLWFAVFSRIKKFLAELRRELVTKSTSGGCDQFETSPEAIEQELRPALCERRQTDRHKTNYRVDLPWYHFFSFSILLADILISGVAERRLLPCDFAILFYVHCMLFHFVLYVIFAKIK